MCSGLITFYMIQRKKINNRSNAPEGNFANPNYESEPSNSFTMRGVRSSLSISSPSLNGIDMAEDGDYDADDDEDECEVTIYTTPKPRAAFIATLSEK